MHLYSLGPKVAVGVGEGTPVTVGVDEDATVATGTSEGVISEERDQEPREPQAARQNIGIHKIARIN